MLSNMTDEQNAFLNKLAYAEPNISAQRGQSLGKALKESGESSLYKEAKRLGMDDLVLRDYVNNNDAGSESGFSAIAFEDPDTGEVGMSFRGTDNLDNIQLDNQEDMIDNIATALTGASPQAVEAREFFRRNCAEGKENYLYGHSKGGELAAEVFAEYHDQVAEAHVINPQPINYVKLTLEQRAAFQSGRYDAMVVDGDIVWGLGGCPYPVRFVKCKESHSDGFFKPHEIGAIVFDESGNAVEEPYPYMRHPLQGLVLAVEKVLIPQLQLGLAPLAVVISTGVRIAEFMVYELPVYAQQFAQAVIRAVEKVCKFTKEVMDSIQEFFSSVADTVKNWLKENLDKGYKYASSNPTVMVDTAKLRDSAQRLQLVNKRIKTLDGRLDQLYNKVGLLDLWDLIQADLLTGYSTRLTKAANYLLDTAEDFEAVETRLKKQL